MTKVLVVGGGAREHAIVDALARSGAMVYAALKNTNPGILRLAKTHKLLSETDAPGIVAQAKAWDCELAVLGMDAAVAAGVADALNAAGIPTASPTKAAGEIEWNKRFMRELLDAHKIPGRIKYKTFSKLDGLAAFIDDLGDVVVKPIGLTGGKGVKVMGDHLADRSEAFAYAKEVLETGYAGDQVLIEEKLDGEEFSLQCFCDGRTAVPMPAVQDHKRAFEGDKGPNTGGMGSYSGADGLLPFVTREEYDAALAITQRIVDAMREEDRSYVGTMYAQFMLTREGPRVIEINARFGDPEAMNVLDLLESDYVEAVRAMTQGTLSKTKIQFSPQATVCKYVVPEGYGTKPAANEPLSVDEDAIAKAGAKCYYAAVNAQSDGTLRTTTSRAVGVVARGATIEEANGKVEAALPHVTGPKLFARHDIGTRALVERRVAHMRAIRG